MINSYDFKIAHPKTFKQVCSHDRLLVHYKCPQNTEHLNVFNHYNDIVFTLDGKKKLHHDLKTVELTSNQAVFVRKSAFTQEMYYTAGWEVIALSLSDDYLKQLLHQFQASISVSDVPEPTADMLLEIHVNDRLKTCFLSMLTYMDDSQSKNLDDILDLKFRELVYNIITDPKNKAILAYLVHLTDQVKIPIWEIMDANYMYNLTIEEYARLAGRSLASFKRDFKEYYRTSPGKWLKEKRLYRAKNYLVSSNKQISEIAFICGFENLSHFSRIFKDTYHMSPKAFRLSKKV